MNWFEKMQADTLGVTVTKFKTYRGGGEFGPKGGFEATFVLAGKVIARVQDDNFGGPLQITNADSKYFELAAKYAADHQRIEEFEKGSVFAYHVVNAHEVVSAFKRKCKTKVLAIGPDCKDEELITYNTSYSLETAAKIRTRDGANLYFINEHV